MAGRRGFLGPLLLALPLLAGAVPTRLVLLHVNDQHCWFAPREGRLEDRGPAALGGAPALGAMVQEFRDAHPGAVLFLDAGDLFTGTPISTLTRGRAGVETENLLRPDLFQLGNHEFDHGLASLREAFAVAEFPVLQGNLRFAEGPNWPASAELERAGLRVGVLGLVTDALRSVVDRRMLDGVGLEESETFARRWLEENAGRFDLRVALSHRGWEEDSLLALRVPGFDVIVGGHSHTWLPEPRRVGGSWIVQAGDFGRWLGVDTLWVEPGLGLVDLKGGLLPVVDDGRSRPDLAALVGAQEARMDSLLSERVAVLDGDWIRDSRGECAIGDWLAEAVRLGAGAEIAWWNSGGIRKDLAAGPVTLRDLWEIAPFGNEIVLASLSGAQIRRLYSEQAARGSSHLHFDGMRIAAGPDGGVGEIDVGGAPLDDDRLYRVAMGDFVWSNLARRDWIDSAAANVEHTGRIDRDLLIERARAQGRIVAAVDGRWGPGEAGER